MCDDDKMNCCMLRSVLMRMFYRTGNPLIHRATHLLVAHSMRRETYTDPLIAFVVRIRIKHKWNLSLRSSGMSKTNCLVEILLASSHRWDGRMS